MVFVEAEGTDGAGRLEGWVDHEPVVHCVSVAVPCADVGTIVEETGDEGGGNVVKRGAVVGKGGDDGD